MSDHAPKIPQKEAASSSDAPDHEMGSPLNAFTDSRPEAIAQRKLQTSLGQSPQVQQAVQLQSIANQSTQMQRLTQLQAAADTHVATPLVQRRENKSGLPEQLQTGMEELSGMDMSDVKVHYNSAQPAQLQALAYAQGNDIHIGPGQEQHLPHEAWHVVQQRQGRVQPTRQLKGMALNDDSALEREADEMGAKAMGMREAVSNPEMLGKTNSALKAPLQKKANPSSSVVQRIVTSLSVKTVERIITEGTEKVELIDKINIIGRPQNVFTGSAGDHSTAFVVHRKGFAQQLEDCTFPEGVDLLKKMLNAAKNLPGYSLKDELPDKHKDRLTNVQDELEKLLGEDYSKSSAKTLSNLQSAINCYFEFRELIPLSTINIGKKSKAISGKGKGESTYVSILEQHANGDKRAKKDRQDSIVLLFDTSSLGFAVIEHDDSKLKEIAPGMQFLKSILDRMKYCVNQHFESIKLSFPSALDDLLEKDVKIELIKKLGLESQIWFAASANKLLEENISLQKITNRQTENAKLAPPKEKERILSDNVTKLLKIENNNTLVKEFKKTYKELYNEELDINDIKNGIFISDEDIIQKPTKKKKQTVEDLLESNSSNESLNEEDEEKKSPLGIQILIQGDDTIQGIEMAGRSPSPIMGGGMGAHTTAWVVHVDRVIKALKGKTLEEALSEMDKTLVQEAKGLWKDRQKKKFIFSSDNHEDQLEIAEKNLDKMSGWKKEMSHLSKMMHLQSYINLLLTYINFIPGSTVNSTNTNGNSEGTKRRTLRKFEEGGKEHFFELKCAIEGMLDLKEVDNDLFKHALLKSQHKAILKETYSKSYEAVYEAKHQDCILEEDEKSKLKIIKRRKNKKNKD